MFGSTARCAWMLAAVATAGCGFKANVDPGRELAALSTPVARVARLEREVVLEPQAPGARAERPSSSSTTPGRRVRTAAPRWTRTAASRPRARSHPPDIMLVMDRSLSMTNDVNDKTCTGATGNNGNCGANSSGS